MIRLVQIIFVAMLFMNSANAGCFAGAICTPDGQVILPPPPPPPPPPSEGFLIVDAKIKSIEVGAFDSDGFSVELSKGEGFCYPSFSFWKSDDVTPSRWKAALSVAISAMVTGKSIDVYSFTDDRNCSSAASITIKH